MAVLAEVLGSHLQEMRSMSGLSQYDLAVQVGIDPSALSRLEAGKTRCSVEMFLRICDCLSLDAADSLRSLQASLRMARINDQIGC